MHQKAESPGKKPNRPRITSESPPNRHRIGPEKRSPIAVKSRRGLLSFERFFYRLLFKLERLLLGLSGPRPLIVRGRGGDHHSKVDAETHFENIFHVRYHQPLALCSRQAGVVVRICLTPWGEGGGGVLSANKLLPRTPPSLSQTGRGPGKSLLG